MSSAQDNAPAAAMPEDLNPRYLRRRLIQLGVVGVVVVAIVLLLPGLSSVRDHFRHADAGWLGLAAAAELLSTASYVVVFRAVFCPRMTWQMSYEIGMAEQAANSLLPVGGAGGLALGAWALHRGGMPTGHIARRTVAFFLVTSATNVGLVVLVGLALATGLFPGESSLALTLVPAGVAAVAFAAVAAMPRIARGRRSKVRPIPRPGDGDPTPKASGKLAVLAGTTVEGVEEALGLLRDRRALLGALGWLCFDVAALGLAFRAFGHQPQVGVLLMAYLLGQLGGLVPLPGGIGGVDGGLIGAFVLYGVSASAAAAAVLAYRALVLWIPALLGSAAFVSLRRTLREADRPAAMCVDLGEIETVSLPEPSSATG